jgi:UDPglucose--hexose-1-phosphate uridylyltransferase
VELRKDPITQSWVRVGQPEPPPAPGGCPLCPVNMNMPALLELPAGRNAQVRVVPHFNPLYRVEGEVERLPEGIYDRMRPVGAHEIIVESPNHGVDLSSMTDDQIAVVLDAYVQRITDLKRDPRFKYVAVFRNHGVLAGAEFDHPSSQITATMFVPRRILYELRSARRWYEVKERCVFCDIAKQEERKGTRVVDTQGEYVAYCPFASRVPFELWIQGRRHNHLFERPMPGANRRDLAALLGRSLRRLEQISSAYHLVVHTAPNTITPKSMLVPSYWRTIAEDFHWHIEILPIVEQRSKSYSIKEVYFNALLPEQAAERLRQIDPQPSANVPPKIDSRR